MLKWLWIVLVACIAAYFCDEVLQERAEIKYCNPKYISNAQAFTRRQKRGEPYKTNITGTLLRAWGNNVTVELSIKSNLGAPLSMVMKFCDIIKHKWIVDFVLKYVGIQLTCPLPPAFYAWRNVEVPPKNFPFPIPKGVHLVNVTLFITDTKELMVLFLAKLYIK